MSDADPNYEATDTEDGQAPQWVKDLRRDAAAAKKRATEAEAELASLKRDKVFDDAGIPADKAGALLRKAYDGDLDLEAVKAAAVEYGILEAAPPPAPSVPAEELAAHQRASATTGVSETPPDLIARINAASSPEEVTAIMAEANGS